MKATPDPQEAKMPITPDPSHEHQLVFTSSQAARYLGVSLATVRRWTDAGYLTGYRTPGGQRRFSREQLDGFIDSLQRTGDTSARRTEVA
jgi:excisionase family DNA binding protein